MLARTCNIILKGTVGGLRPRCCLKNASSPLFLPVPLTRKKSLAVSRAGQRFNKSSISGISDVKNRSFCRTHRSFTNMANPNDTVPIEREITLDFKKFLISLTQNLLKEVNLSADYFEAQQDIVDALHKQFLGDFWKQSLAFNPLANPRNIDLRFMPRQMDDAVYKIFERYACAPNFFLHSLRAISGAGKTATILNAIGRNQYLFYVQCGLRNNADPKDYLDVPAQDFIEAVRQQNENLIMRGADKYGKTKACIAYCKVFWLCRLMLLDEMKKKFPGLTSQQWIMWSNDGGQKILRPLQAQALAQLRELMDKYPLWLETPTLHDLLSEYHEEYPGVWFAVDEAQVIQEHLKDDIISVGSTPADEHPTNLLHALAVHSLSRNALTVIAGTRMARFEQVELSFGGKGTKIYRLAEMDESYPYVTSEQAMKILSEWINLDGITEQNLERARHQLQGRLRYVFGFLRFLFNAARDLHERGHSGEGAERKNKIFEQGLTSLELDINRMMNVQWEKVMKITNTVPVTDLPPRASNPSFPEHILTLLVAHLSKDPVTWDADEFLKYYKITPEDTGFLFFDKVKKDGKQTYEYSIREPQLVPTVVKLLMPYYPQQALRSLAEVDNDDPSLFGVKLEKCFGILMMASNFKQFLQKLFSGKRSWCKDLVCQWSDVNKVKSLPDIQDVIKEVRALKKTTKQGQEALLRSVSRLGNLPLFQERSAKSTLEEDANLLLEIAGATDDKIGELLFMYAQPTGYLLRPSDQMGPDLIGFCTTSKGEKVLVLVSLSPLAGSSEGEITDKFEKNQYKQEPTYFYSRLTKKKAGEASKSLKNIREFLTFMKPHATMKKIPLPEKILMLCASMPDKKSYPIQKGAASRPQAVRIFINESNIGDFSVGLRELIARRIAHLSKEKTEKKL